MNKKILIAGESWVKHISHIKGVDMFTTCEYETGVTWLKEALESNGFEVSYMPGHEVPDNFPSSKEELAQYGAVALSDIGSNSLQLSSTTFTKGKIAPDRCQAIVDYVKSGGGLAMIGGYLSFAGIDCKARYGSTEIGGILPVKVLDIDDRVEKPQGIIPKVCDPAHEIMNGLGDWPHFLGYNKTLIRPEGQLLAEAGGDPFIAVRQVEKGKTAIFASDAAPHWGPMEFLSWSGYKKFWGQFFGWLCKA